ncbi:MAG TPA: MBL fold metallo-hydrolase [Alphaproteobacteria bacterium]|nr:MBL fold metallo-hydrolase [Alphaproteobacteria bacterium]
MKDNGRRTAIGREGSCAIGAGHGAYAEVGLLDPAGAGTASYEIAPGTVTQLTPRIRRLTAPNPGFMTGPGTNSYLIGDDPAGDIAVIDPGPLDDAHIAALLNVGGRIRWILTTHTHPDHSPAAAILKEKTRATVMGMLPPVGEHQDQSFKPDVVLKDGARIDLTGCALKAIHTPGHASNHLCYLLEQDRLLFTGDHVMQGSTVVINPPDGNMIAYIASLRMLQGRGIAYLAPGHGFLIGAPDDMIDVLVRHRFVRESMTLKALREMGSATLEALTPVVYNDVPEFKHKWAARSLLAHLVKLKADGAAAEKDGVWRLR